MVVICDPIKQIGINFLNSSLIINQSSFHATRFTNTVKLQLSLMYTSQTIRLRKRNLQCSANVDWVKLDLMTPTHLKLVARVTITATNTT